MPSKVSESSNLVQLVEYYLEQYAATSSYTARAKRLDLQAFLVFLTKRNKAKAARDLAVADWTPSSVQNFVDALLDKGAAPSSVSRRLATIKHFGRTLADEFAGFQNPARKIKAPKVEVTKPKALEPEEVAQCLEQAVQRVTERPGFNRLRNLTIVQLLLDTGLRVDEIRNLRRSQLDDDFRWFTNVKTKSRRYRNVYVSDSMRVRLHEYLDERAKELKRFSSSLTKRDDDSLPLFISGYKATLADPDTFLMGAKTMWRVVREISGELKAHPHLLRHSFAMDLLRSSNDIRLVSQALGHSDVRVTMRYTNRKDEEVAEAIEKARRK